MSPQKYWLIFPCNSSENRSVRRLPRKPCTLEACGPWRFNISGCHEAKCQIGRTLVSSAGLRKIAHNENLSSRRAWSQCHSCRSDCRGTNLVARRDEIKIVNTAAQTSTTELSMKEAVSTMRAETPQTL